METKIFKFCNNDSQFSKKNFEEILVLPANIKSCIREATIDMGSFDTLTGLVSIPEILPKTCITLTIVYGYEVPVKKYPNKGKTKVCKVPEGDGDINIDPPKIKLVDVCHSDTPCIDHVIPECSLCDTGETLITVTQKDNVTLSIDNFIGKYKACPQDLSKDWYFKYKVSCRKYNYTFNNCNVGSKNEAIVSGKAYCIPNSTPTTPAPSPTTPAPVGTPTTPAPSPTTPAPVGTPTTPAPVGTPATPAPSPTTPAPVGTPTTPAPSPTPTPVNNMFRCTTSGNCFIDNVNGVYSSATECNAACNRYSCISNVCTREENGTFIQLGQCQLSGCETVPAPSPTPAPVVTPAPTPAPTNPCCDSTCRNATDCRGFVGGVCGCYDVSTPGLTCC